MSLATPQRVTRFAGGSSTRTPGSRGGQAGNGLLKDGQWYCNCDPRLPANFFETKKEGPNKGKWFYTCQRQREDQCGFFLWKDEADRRATDGFITTSIGPKSAAPPLPPLSTPRRRLFSGISTTGGNSTGRAPVEPETEPESDGGQGTDDGLFVAQETPSNKRKRVIKIEDDSDKGEPMPQAANSKRQRIVSGASSETLGHSPIQTRNLASDQSARHVDKNNITQHVLDLLEGTGVNNAIRSAIRDALEKHRRREEGVKKGRDASRAELHQKTELIAKQAQRIVDLEDQLKAYMSASKSRRSRHSERQTEDDAL